jgi:hypothetical protein
MTTAYVYSVVKCERENSLELIELSSINIVSLFRFPLVVTPNQIKDGPYRTSSELIQLSNIGVSI